MSADRQSHDRSIMDPEPRRPDFARELITRAATAKVTWFHLHRGQLSHQEIGRCRLADHANAEVLRRITADHGWPGWSLVGHDGATAAWQIALRAENQPAVQKYFTDRMHQAVRAGEAPARQWAHLRDRCLLGYGAAQEFGTQYRHGPDGPQRLPVAEPDTLDERRAEVGLPPAADALASLCRRLTEGSSPHSTTVDEEQFDVPTAELEAVA
ncbi:DUF6624 domain-containing protein [Streptomyces bauhiniae]|uniref:DUF6624 domain-containing protein n=1 Tax=Streptomyces bauhiniae TaxID=2340725 RepID=UPI0037CE35B5